nr:reverse transcriptase domain-containing protein [Tanacetum cinerariifolium]
MEILPKSTSNNSTIVIIAKDLSSKEKTALINVLKTRKKAIAWKLTDIKGIEPEFCSHKILLEENYSPKVQSQRRVNLKIHDVIKKEVEKLLDAGLIYPISDSPWRKQTERERDELKLTLEILQNSSKSLNTLLDSQVSEKSKAGLGYKELIPESFVNSSELLEKQDNRSDKGYMKFPPPLTGNYMPPKCYLRLIDEHFESEPVDVSTISSSDVKTVKTVNAKVNAASVYGYYSLKSMFVEKLQLLVNAD